MTLRAQEKKLECFSSAFFILRKHDRSAAENQAFGNYRFFYATRIGSIIASHLFSYKRKTVHAQRRGYISVQADRQATEMTGQPAAKVNTILTAPGSA
jgi:hypothetical protein